MLTLTDGHQTKSQFDLKFFFHLYGFPSLIVNNQGKGADLVEVQRAFVDVFMFYGQLLAKVCMLFLDPWLES